MQAESTHCRITVEDVARYPPPGTVVPTQVKFSPDDRLITYLFSAEGTLVQQLYAFDVESGTRHVLVDPREGGTTEDTVSPEEALRRERMRQLGQGVTQYAWAKSGDRILLPLQGVVYVKDVPAPGQPCQKAPLRHVVNGNEHPALDPQFSPDGRWVAYVQDAEVYVVPSAGDAPPRQVTEGARDTGKVHGLAEYVAQEEMGRFHGFWWSADSRWLAFTEVDETHIPIYRIMHLGKDTVGADAQEDHRYPFAGGANAKVRLGVVPIAGGEPVWMDLGENEDVYLARVQWLPDGTLSAQIENREQTRLDLVRFDPATGARAVLLTETSDVWINLHDSHKPLKGGGFIWASERTGFRHLYLYDAEGGLVRPLTRGEWMVDDVVAVDEEGERVYFTATLDSPLERHLYTVSFAGELPRKITTEPGMHTPVVAHSFKMFVDTYESLEQPPIVQVRGLETPSALADGGVWGMIYNEADPRVVALDLRPPELVTIQNRDGVTLYGAVYRPPQSFGPGPYPTLVDVYGGPHAQRVTRGWRLTCTLRAQYLRSLGFLVFVLDNRGSARRGLAFEGAIKHDLGHLEVEDQVDGVRWLVEQGLTDPDRVGVYGWSYGGYMAVMCLLRAADTFRVAVAGAPVSNFDGYDTHYTERYMGTPETNPQGYQSGSLMHHVDKLKGKLLLVHGLIDENVHFRHTARLINALIAARQPYDLLLFPDARHMPRKLADRVYMEERIRDYFVGMMNCEL